MARARFAIDPASRDPNGAETQPKSDMIKQFTAQAREKYAAHPELLPKTELPADIQEMADTKLRIDAALEESRSLLSEARAQLAAPKVPPEELTPDEVAELEREREWDRMYREADAYNDAWLGRNEALFEEVMGSIDECQAKGIPIPHDLVVPEPPPTPTLEEMKVPEETAAWIADSKKHLPPPPPRPPPKPSPAVEALKKINATAAAAAPSRKKPRGKGEGPSDFDVLDASLIGTDGEVGVGRASKSRWVKERRQKEFVTVCSWIFGITW